MHLTKIQFHSKWAEAIKEEGWGLSVLARILLRKELGREPTWQEQDQTLEYRSEECKNLISPDEIKTAYLEGKEVHSQPLGIATLFAYYDH